MRAFNTFDTQHITAVDNWYSGENISAIRVLPTLPNWPKFGKKTFLPNINLLQKWVSWFKTMCGVNTVDELEPHLNTIFKLIDLCEIGRTYTWDLVNGTSEYFDNQSPFVTKLLNFFKAIESGQKQLFTKQVFDRLCIMAVLAAGVVARTNLNYYTKAQIYSTKYYGCGERDSHDEKYGYYNPRSANYNMMNPTGRPGEEFEEPYIPQFFTGWYDNYGSNNKPNRYLLNDSIAQTSIQMVCDAIGKNSSVLWLLQQNPAKIVEIDMDRFPTATTISDIIVDEIEIDSSITDVIGQPTAIAFVNPPMPIGPSSLKWFRGDYDFGNTIAKLQKKILLQGEQNRNKIAMLNVDGTPYLHNGSCFLTIAPGSGFTLLKYSPTDNYVSAYYAGYYIVTDYLEGTVYLYKESTKTIYKAEMSITNNILSVKMFQDFTTYHKKPSLVYGDWAASNMDGYDYSVKRGVFVQENFLLYNQIGSMGGYKHGFATLINNENDCMFNYHTVPLSFFENENHDSYHYNYRPAWIFHLDNEAIHSVLPASFMKEQAVYVTPYHIGPIPEEVFESWDDYVNTYVDDPLASSYPRTYPYLNVNWSNQVVPFYFDTHFFSKLKLYQPISEGLGIDTQNTYYILPPLVLSENKLFFPKYVPGYRGTALICAPIGTDGIQWTDCVWYPQIGDYFCRSVSEGRLVDYWSKTQAHRLPFTITYPCSALLTGYQDQHGNYWYEITHPWIIHGTSISNVLHSDPHRDFTNKTFYYPFGRIHPEKLVYSATSWYNPYLPYWTYRIQTSSFTYGLNDADRETLQRLLFDLDELREAPNTRFWFNESEMVSLLSDYAKVCAVLPLAWSTELVSNNDWSIKRWLRNTFIAYYLPLIEDTNTSVALGEYAGKFVDMIWGYPLRWAKANIR